MHHYIESACVGLPGLLYKSDKQKGVCAFNMLWLGIQAGDMRMQMEVRCMPMDATCIQAISCALGCCWECIGCVAGAHSLGRCHADRSGFVNPWTNAPTTFSNLYFQELLNTKWYALSFSITEGFFLGQHNFSMRRTYLSVLQATVLWVDKACSRLSRLCTAYATQAVLPYCKPAASFSLDLLSR